MADKHPVDPLPEFDSLLREELALEPSHEFLPRVRERIRTEPSPSRWPAVWALAPFMAAAALVVVAIGVFVLSRETATSPAPLSIASATSPTQAPTAATPPRSANPEKRTANPPSRLSRQVALRRAGSEARSAGQPEVIVDARQREALLSFIEMTRQGQVSAETFALTTPPPVLIADHVKVIAVDDVVVSPIVPGGVLFLELERK